MQFYLINNRPKLHHRKWRKLRAKLPVNMSTVPNFLNFSNCCSPFKSNGPTFIRKLCY